MLPEPAYCWSKQSKHQADAKPKQIVCTGKKCELTRFRDFYRLRMIEVSCDSSDSCALRWEFHISTCTNHSASSFESGKSGRHCGSCIFFKQLELKGIALPKTWSQCTECEAEPALWEDLRACDVHFDIQLCYAVDCLKLICVDFFTCYLYLLEVQPETPPTQPRAPLCQWRLTLIWKANGQVGKLSCSYNKILQKLRMFETINEIVNVWKPSSLISVVSQSFQPLSARFWGHCTAYSASGRIPGIRSPNWSACHLVHSKKLRTVTFSIFVDFKLSFTQGETPTQTYLRLDNLMLASLPDHCKISRFARCEVTCIPRSRCIIIWHASIAFNTATKCWSFNRKAKQIRTCVVHYEPWFEHDMVRVEMSHEAFLSNQHLWVYDTCFHKEG